MMRLSSTYHLYKIALLVKTADAAKDSVILRSGEPSKALYFIASGTVEVIQVRRTLLTLLFSVRLLLVDVVGGILYAAEKAVANASGFHNCEKTARTKNGT